MIKSIQWRSQGLEVGWAQRVWGTEVPLRGPGTEPRWGSPVGVPGGGLGAKPPEAKHTYAIYSGQTHFPSSI